jgi:hypothetical protein
VYTVPAHERTPAPVRNRSNLFLGYETPSFILPKKIGKKSQDAFSEKEDPKGFQII